MPALIGPVQSSPKSPARCVVARNDGKVVRSGQRVRVALVVDEEKGAIFQIEKLSGCRPGPPGRRRNRLKRNALLVNKPCALLIGTSAFKASFSKKS